MKGQRNGALSGIEHLAEEMHSKKYRDAYVASHNTQVLARQVREMRGHQSQDEFASDMGTRQTIISRLENPSYGPRTLATCYEIARKRDIAFFARWVDFPTFLRLSRDLSQSALNPQHYDAAVVDQAAHRLASAQADGTAIQFARYRDRFMIDTTGIREAKVLTVPAANEDIIAYDVPEAVVRTGTEGN